MKHIIVATDFSKSSLNALEYALEFAKSMNAEVELFNSFVSVPTIGIDGGPHSIHEDLIQAGLNNNEEKIQHVLEDIDDRIKSKITVTTKVVSGDPVYNLLERAKDGGFDYILMGTMGESRLEEILFGSTTIGVMREATCPVIAVPPTAKFYGIKQIVYASDLHETDIAVLKHVCSLAESFDANLVVFHAFDEDNMTQQEDADEFNKLLEREIRYPKLRKESSTYNNTYDAILDTVKKDLANLIVMREQSRNIFSRIFHPDMVKRINFHTTIPLLVYNENSL